MSAQIANNSTIPLPIKERRKQPLCTAVKVALEIYFQQLEGHEPDSLYRMVMEEVERPLLECTMNYCAGNQTKAVDYLGLNRGTLRKKLKFHGLC